MATRILRLFSVAAALCHSVSAEDLLPCGEARYFPSEYTCYNSSTLCPITFGIATLPCGGACYSKEMYRCDSGKLKLLAEASGPFTMAAHGTSLAVNNQVVRACGNYLAIGGGSRQCNSCRNVAAGIDCSSYGNQTVLLPGGEMAVDLPGGQYWYISPTDGALMFTEGGNSTDPEIALAGRDVTVYNRGFFTYDGSPHYWLACLRTLPGGNVGTSRVYRIYAPTSQNLQRTDCEQIKLVTDSVASRKIGAYKYE